MNRPFNEANYKALLEGLEVTIIKKTKLERTQRIDAEFYSKENLNVISTISKLNPKPISDFFRVSDGNHMTISDQFSQDGIPYYRGGDIYNFFIENTTNPLTIPDSIYNWPNLKRSHLQKGDVLVSIVGAIIGNLSLVTTNQKATCSCKLAILRPTRISPQFAAIYLKSKYGQNQIQKFRRGSGQTGLILEDFDQLMIPEISDKFSNVIVSFVVQAHQKLEQSLLAYKNAEILLLESLGLQDFKPSTEAVNIKSFKESFGESGRLDAEYYQKKYEEVIKHITSQNYATLKDIVSIKKSIEPGSDVYADEGLPFLRVADYNKFGITDPDKKLSYTFCNENAELINKLKPKKETILFSKDGSVGTAYMLRKDEEMITSGAILHLNVRDKKHVIPEYLTLVLNSKIVKMQSERDAGGSIILHWRISEIENVVVPIIPIEKQEEIATLVEESFRLKKQSEQLLEAAKKAVEMAIEEGEEGAMEWMAANSGCNVKPQSI